MRLAVLIYKIIVSGNFYNGQFSNIQKIFNLFFVCQRNCFGSGFVFYDQNKIEKDWEIRIKYSEKTKRPVNIVILNKMDKNKKSQAGKIKWMVVFGLAFFLLIFPKSTKAYSCEPITTSLYYGKGWGPELCIGLSAPSPVLPGQTFSFGYNLDIGPFFIDGTTIDEPHTINSASVVFNGVTQSYRLSGVSGAPYVNNLVVGSYGSRAFVQTDNFTAPASLGNYTAHVNTVVDGLAIYRTNSLDWEKVIEVSIPGVCGSADGGTFGASGPSSNLCSTGTPTAPASLAGQWRWGCSRYAGSGVTSIGSLTPCSALDSSYVPPPPPPPAPKIAQAANQELGGFAWSSNIGWISFNCLDGGVCATSNYKVVSDDLTGNMSGYAWSSNIGWIRFDPGGGYPGNPNYDARINLGTGDVTGWARACAVFQSGCSGVLRPDYERGGWDGWIKMAKFSADGGGDYGLSFDISAGSFRPGTVGTGNLSDRYFAWGSDVIGWINFCITPGTVTCVGRVSGALPLPAPATTTPPGGRREVPPN